MEVLPINAIVLLMCGIGYQMGGEGKLSADIFKKYLTDMDINIYNRLVMNNAYVAGFFDGDGSVWIAKTKINTHYPASFQMYVNVTNTNKEVCKAFYKKFGGTIRTKNWEKYKYDKWKSQYMWSCASLQAKKFLKIILPYLIIKRERVELALQFQERKKKNGRRTPEQYKFEVACYKKMKKFNHRGTGT